MYLLKNKKKREYVLYHGEEIICYGTLEDIAKFLNVKIKTARFYSSPVHKKRDPNGYAITIIPEDEEEEMYEKKEKRSKIKRT